MINRFNHALHHTSNSSCHVLHRPTSNQVYCCTIPIHMYQILGLVIKQAIYNFLLKLVIMTSICIAQCSGSRKMTPFAFRLAPCKPCSHYATHVATGSDCFFYPNGTNWIAVRTWWRRKGAREGEANRQAFTWWKALLCSICNSPYWQVESSNWPSFD